MKTLLTWSITFYALILMSMDLPVAASRCKPSEKCHHAMETSSTRSRGVSSLTDANSTVSRVSPYSEVGPRSSSVSHRSSSTHFKQVTSLQARVQGDRPQWNTDNERFVSTYYTTFDEKYRAVLDTVNMAAIEGALKYVQAECINASVVTNCKRKNNIKYLVFYETTIVQPAAAMDFYANITDEYDSAIEHCPFVPMDGGRCGPNGDGTIPAVCSQYLGTHGQPELGFCISATLQDHDVIAPYPHNYWFSFPNSCPQSRWSEKTEACRLESAGGMCALGVKPDGKSCTFSYDVLGYIALDEVVGITSLVNPRTGATYANYSEFCAAGGVEFNVLVSGDDVTWLDGLDFWANPDDSDANVERAQKVLSAYSALIEKNAMTSDGGRMKPLPTVASLTASNPPCYKNSDVCATAKFGCQRSYYSQICQVCTSPASNCVKAPHLRGRAQL